jgi:hypothetical protein
MNVCFDIIKREETACTMKAEQIDRSGWARERAVEAEFSI